MRTLRRTAGVVGLIATLAVTTTQSATAEPTGVLWPGNGRMLTGSLVLGGSIVGGGTLEVVDGVITGETASVDTAPSVLSLRMVTFVPDPDGGGYSAVLRYRVPIVQLHEWRGVAVRMTQTVVLRPPTGQAQAVQIQPDGTTAVGTFGDDRTFTRTGDSESRIVGNVAVIHVPESVGVTPDWTVQAIAEVSADAPFHSFNPATGFVAGTSIVPVGWLTGETQSSLVGGIADALTTLTRSITAEKPELPDALRITSVRIEGSGRDQVVVVTTAGSPLDAPIDDFGHINVLLTPPGFGSSRHPYRLNWIDGAKTDAVVFVDGLQLGTVPVTVVGNETRFAIGAVVPAAPVTLPAGDRLDTLSGSIVVTLAADGDVVSSADGVSVRPTTTDDMTISFEGPEVTVTHPSTNTTATGFVSADGEFVALSDTEHFVGTVDQYGSAVVHLSRILPGSAGLIRRQSPGPQTVPAGDYTTSGVGGSGLDDPGPYQVAMAFLKGLGPLAGLELTNADLPALDLGWMSGQPSSTEAFTATGQPSGAQGGEPDWPLVPVSDTAAATSGFLVSVTAGTIVEGFPNELVTPWTDSALLATSAPVVPTTPSTTAVPTTTSAGGTAPGDTVAAGSTPVAIAASESDDSSAITVLIVVLVLIAIAIVVAIVITRRRRSSPAPPIPAQPLPALRTVHGTRTTSVSRPVQGWSIGVRAVPGQRSTSARDIELKDEEA